MSYEEAIKIINEISARLGATATNLYPKLVKYGIVSNGIKFIIAFLIMFVSAFTLKKCGEKIFNEDSDDEIGIYIFMLIFTTLLFIFSTVFCFQSIYDLMLWSTVPEIQAIDFVLKWRK